MKVCLSINSDVGGTLTSENLWYPATATLVEEFIQRGHDLTLVHPEELKKREGKVWAERVLTKRGERLVEGEGRYIRPDVFFIRSLGENTSNPEITTKRLLETLSPLENEGIAVYNSVAATKYEDKALQKGLNLPFIPGYDISSLDELTRLIEREERGVIAKPIIGFRARGVVYLKSKEDITRTFESDENVKSYLFEEFIPDREERRYIFIDGKIVIKRVMQREGEPGNEIFGRRTFNPNPDLKELKVVHQAIEQTGMFYGCVDFRGAHVLEINGSGTANLSLDRGRFLYDLAPQIVSGLEHIL